MFISAFNIFWVVIHMHIDFSTEWILHTINSITKMFYCDATLLWRRIFFTDLFYLRSSVLSFWLLQKSIARKFSAEPISLLKWMLSLFREKINFFSDVNSWIRDLEPKNHAPKIFFWTMKSYDSFYLISVTAHRFMLFFYVMMSDLGRDEIVSWVMGLQL